MLLDSLGASQGETSEANGRIQVGSHDCKQLSANNKLLLAANGCEQFAVVGGDGT